MRTRLVIAYDGRDFAGWQRQKNAPTVQQTVEDALSELYDGRVVLHGAGRTDAGVHARGQVAHLGRVEGRRRLPLKALVHGPRLPRSVRILAAERMADDADGEPFHARKSAVGKEYVFRIVTGRVVDPFDFPYVLHLRHPLDVGAMRRAARALPGRHDFSAFAVAGGCHASGVRRLFAARVDASPEKSDPSSREIRFTFWGEGFLRGMVRSLAGSLIEIGRGKRPAGDVERLLEPGRTRDEAGFTADAHGLCLERVAYPRRWRVVERWPVGRPPGRP